MRWEATPALPALLGGVGQLRQQRRSLLGTHDREGGPASNNSHIDATLDVIDGTCLQRQCALGRRFSPGAERDRLRLEILEEVGSVGKRPDDLIIGANVEANAGAGKLLPD